ncbi:MAG TPA: hypothetical protein VKB39_09460, partial [Candidatus Baltobacteraceae bacterium]|nr:hypothetical protein [Candidatus Baltobacteraceae bacterium]
MSNSSFPRPWILLVAVLLLGSTEQILTPPVDYRPPIPRATPSAEPSAGGLSVYGQVSGQYAANTSGGQQLGDSFATSIL